MNQFFNIFKFEFSSYLKNKIFVGLTIFLVLAIAVFLSFPRIVDVFDNIGLDGSSPEPDTSLSDDNDNSSDDDSAGENNELDTMWVSDLSGNDEKITLEIFQQSMFDKNISLTDKSLDEIKLSVENGEVDTALIINDPTNYTYIVYDVAMYDMSEMIINEVMETNYRVSSMVASGMTVEDASNILTTPIQGETIKIGTNQMDNFFYTYILIFALYMAILLYGNLVATSVASEKSSRAMEMLITSAKPTNLMFGKVLASGFAGFMQMALILGSAFISYSCNKSYWEDNFAVQSIFAMPLSILLFTILFFVLGYALYSFLFGAVGSLASKVEDINTSILPIMFLFIIAFMIVMTSMASGNVDSTVMVVASFVPFTSPMAMFTRIAMGDVDSISIIISVVILVATTIGIGILSAKIYQIGVLLYGTPPKLGTVIKTLFTKQK